MSDLTIITVCPENNTILLDLWKTGAKKHFPDSPLIIEKPNRSLPIGSRQHGDGLNRAIKKVKTSHTLILDLDCVLLDGKWFSTNIEVLGCRKNNKSETMHMMFLCGKTDIFNKYDFSPNVGTDENKEVFDCTNDVGYRLGVLDNNLKVASCNGGKCKNFSKDIQCVEIYYRGRLVASHLGRGSHMMGKMQKTGMELRHQNSIWIKKIWELNR